MGGLGARAIDDPTIPTSKTLASIFDFKRFPLSCEDEPSFPFKFPQSLLTMDLRNSHSGVTLMVKVALNGIKQLMNAASLECDAQSIAQMN